MALPGRSRTASQSTLHGLLRAAGLLVIGAGCAAAQDSTTGRQPGWLVGGSLGVPAYRGDAAPELFTVGVHGTQLRPNRPGADVALGTLPRLLGTGIVAAGARAGVALPVGVPLALPRVLLRVLPRAPARDIVLLPSVGVSLLGGTAGGGGGGTAGYHTGLATVLLGPGGGGLRAGVTWHRFADGDAAVWLWEVGLVRGPRSRPTGVSTPGVLRRAGTGTRALIHPQ